ncbi:MAG: M1 family metallopeptidase [Acidimicrobiales bacterium]|nr:M1 family metallopeptidase [Acidimicrobiales bacterium]
MIPAVAAPRRRVARATALAAALALAAAAPACTDDGGSDEGTPPTVATDGLGADVVDDVPDEVFGGLGDPRIDVDSYDVTLALDPESDELSGTAQLVLSATTDAPLESFTLDLRGPTATSATVDGDPAEVVEADDGEIEVVPARELLPGRPVEVVVAYEGEPDQTPLPAAGVPIGLQHDDEGGWFTFSKPNGTSTWTPANDHPSDPATWRIALDVPDGAVGVASGHLADADPPVIDRRRRWVWELTQPTAPYLVAVAAGDLELRPGDGSPAAADGGEASRVDAVPAGSASMADLGLGDHDAILAFYAERFGPDPDPDQGVLVVPGGDGLALEARSRPVISAGATGDGPVYILAHELAHRWFGGAAAPASWEDLWLVEAWATYADWLWRDHAGIDPLEPRVAAVAEARADEGIPVRDPVAAATFDLVLQEGGALALHALRTQIGDDAFFAVARRLVAERTGWTMSTEDLVALAEEESGEDLAGFFEAWLDTAPQPPPGG